MYSLGEIPNSKQGIRLITDTQEHSGGMLRRFFRRGNATRNLTQVTPVATGGVDTPLEPVPPSQGETKEVDIPTVTQVVPLESAQADLQGIPTNIADDRQMAFEVAKDMIKEQLVERTALLNMYKKSKRKKIKTLEEFVDSLNEAETELYTKRYGSIQDYPALKERLNYVYMSNLYGDETSAYLKNIIKKFKDKKGKDVSWNEFWYNGLDFPEQAFYRRAFLYSDTSPASAFRSLSIRRTGVGELVDDLEVPGLPSSQGETKN